MTTPVDIAAEAPRRTVLGRRWWKLWLLLFDLCLIAGIVAADRNPYWRLTAVEFNGPEEWAEQAVPYILGISPADNGKSLTVPQ